MVPLDGSELAEQALWVAAHLARSLHGELFLVTVCPPMHAGGGRGIQQDRNAYLEAKAEEVATTHGVRSAAAVLHGWPPEALEEYARASGITLIVMTCHGRSGLSRSWIGSVTHGLLARVAVPTLVLRPGIAPRQQRFYRILVALDGSAGCQDVLTQTVAFGSADSGNEYILAQVLEPREPLFHRSSGHAEEADPSLLRRQEDATRQLERLAARLTRRGMRVTTRVVVAHAVAGRLIELADELGADLIAVGSRRPRVLDRMMLGDVADKLVRGASQPVLLVPTGRRGVRSATARRVRARHSHGAFTRGSWKGC